MKKVIFYGAGQNARDKYQEWIRQGLEPVCFVDGDKQKQNTYFEKWKILSLYEALKRYPDCEIYCTQAPFNLIDVQNYLLRIGIPKEKINTCEKITAGCKLYASSIYPQLFRIYNALQDELSRKLFWGRVEYSCSHLLTGIYRAMICDENMKWIQNKRTYAMIRYGLNGLWDVLKYNYPVQKDKLYLLLFEEEWNEYTWVVDRFMEAMSELQIVFEAVIRPYSQRTHEDYRGIPCISERELLSNIDTNTKIIVGFPGWCLEMKDVVEKYKIHKDILYPIADTAHPQYIEPDILVPEEDEIFVDIGVYDFQNSLDFIEWAQKGFKKIYAFEPDPTCYSDVKAKIEGMDNRIKDKVELVNMGLSSNNGVLEFPAVYKGSGAYGDQQMIEVDVVSLDSYLDGKSVTFVKMDVEGAEMDVLLGMKETICMCKPKLAVCIYHKPEDIFDIATYLLDLVPEYKFYIRHYNSNETETVLFCKI